MSAVGCLDILQEQASGGLNKKFCKDLSVKTTILTETDTHLFV